MAVESAITWLSVPDAGRQLRKSERSIRRWIAEGKLPVRHIGTRIEVGLPADVRPVPASGAPEPDVDRGELEALRSENAELRGELVRAEATLAAVSAERDRLLGLVAGALTTRPALPGPANGHTRRWWAFWKAAEA